MKFTEFLKEKYENLTWKSTEDYKPEPVVEQWGGRGRDDDDDEPKGKGKEEKSQKVFNVGDVLVLVDNKKSSKLPIDAYDFLMTYKTFTVKKVNEKGKIDLGCRISKNTPEGGVEKIYMFSTNRFELASGEKAQTAADVPPTIEPLGETPPVEESPDTNLI